MNEKILHERNCTSNIFRKEEIFGSLRYPESKGLASQDVATPLATELSGSCAETVKDENTDVRLGYIGLGIHETQEVPEANRLLEANARIAGKAARILLDTGCSIYVLSTRFAAKHGITGTRTRS